MAVITREAVGEARRPVLHPATVLPRPVRVAPAIAGLLGTVTLAGGMALALGVDELPVRIGALVAIGVGGYVNGRAGVAPPPDDDDLRRRDQLLRAREQALMEREAAVDSALTAIALHGMDRGAPAARDEAPGADEPEPVADAGVDRGPRSRRLGQLRAVPSVDPLDDDGIDPAGPGGDEYP